MSLITDTGCFRLMCFIKCRRILVQNPVGHISLYKMMMMYFSVFTVSGFPHDNTHDCWNVTSKVDPILTFWTVFIIIIILSIFGQIATAETHNAEHEKCNK